MVIAFNRHKWANNQPQSWYLIKYRHKIQQEQILHMIYTANEDLANILSTDEFSFKTCIGKIRVTNFSKKFGNFFLQSG